MQAPSFCCFGPPPLLLLLLLLPLSLSLRSPAPAGDMMAAMLIWCLVGSRGVLGGTGRAKASINKAEQRGFISFLSLHTTHLSPIFSISSLSLLSSTFFSLNRIHITREKERNTLRR